MGNILIVEHTNILGYKMKRILEENGFRNVALVKDFSAINHQDSYRPDCVIVDLDNRDHNMIQIIKRIRRETDDAPIISISGESDLTILKKAIEAGCLEFVLKPFEAETLISKVYKVYYAVQQPLQDGKSFKTGELFRENALSLKWSEDYTIGVEQIDAEHRGIFENFNKLYARMREGQGHEYYGELLGFLVEYVNTHLEHEEQYQLKISYAGYQVHKEYHEKFRQRINEFMENHKVQSIRDKELISICLFIKDWLIHHILLEDMKIKDIVKGKKV